MVARELSGRLRLSHEESLRLQAAIVRSPGPLSRPLVEPLFREEGKVFFIGDNPGVVAKIYAGYRIAYEDGENGIGRKGFRKFVEVHDEKKGGWMTVEDKLGPTPGETDLFKRDVNDAILFGRTPGLREFVAANPELQLREQQP